MITRANTNPTASAPSPLPQEGTQDPSMAMIELSHVDKYYGTPTGSAAQRFHALKDISLSVPAGEFVVLLGSSGCGKSTLLRCIQGLEPIQKGRLVVGGTVLFDGETGHQLSGEALRQYRTKIGLVFQQFNLFPHLTVMENITLGPIHVLGMSREEADSKAMQLLEKVGLPFKGTAYPAQLSGGQTQRVAIARSLAMNPEVLLFDEPTSALDPVMTYEVLQTIQALVVEQGLTTVVVTHEWSFARRFAHRAVFMHEGAILESAPPQVLEREGQHPETRAYFQHFQAE